MVELIFRALDLLYVVTGLAGLVQEAVAPSASPAGRAVAPAMVVTYVEVECSAGATLPSVPLAEPGMIVVCGAEGLR